ncbi:Anaphase spindle elongation protein 1 [Phytophthora nicotianae]|uniref:Anaphase spindle elongation protein 1 n=1 Tax=Phytophthora nicotianae TaxID=4792 RepID=A0A0W8CVD0_PHYNI|nr:Anaphase spindle elongation protein 1 [Phytophthora nicotianae]
MAISDQTPTNSSSNNHQEFSKLHEMMQNGANEASSYLDGSKPRDGNLLLPERNGPGQSCCGRIQEIGEEVRKDGNNVSDSVVDAAKRSMEQVGTALDNLGKSAQAYDRHVRDSINASAENAKENGSSTLSSWQDSISSLVTSTRDATFQSFEALQNQFAATKKAMAQQASAVADGVSNKASEASDKLKPADTTSKSDPTLMDRATEAMSSGMDYVASALQGSKTDDINNTPTKSS